MSTKNPNEGEQGIQGKSGLQGKSGEQGESGGEGEQGEQGVQGIQGFQGVRGSQGRSGGERGAEGRQGKQGERGKTSSFDKSILAIITLVVIVAGVATYAALSSLSQSTKIAELTEAQAKSIVIRRNDNCLLFERQEKVAIEQVVSTYEFLDDLPRSEYGTPLTAAIVGNLSKQYKDAAATAAPEYCNEPVGSKAVGLPETGLALPKQRDFSQLAKPQ